MRADHTSPLTISTVAHGAVPELFTRELARVIENTLDPNTDATAKRKIRIDITFKPNESRRESSVEVVARSMLADFNGAGGTVFMGRQKGLPVGLSYDPDQLQIEFDDADPIRAVGAGEHLDEDTGEITAAKTA